MVEIKLSLTESQVKCLITAINCLRFDEEFWDDLKGGQLGKVAEEMNSLFDLILSQLQGGKHERSNKDSRS